MYELKVRIGLPLGFKEGDVPTFIFVEKRERIKVDLREWEGRTI